MSGRTTLRYRPEFDAGKNPIALQLWNWELGLCHVNLSHLKRSLGVVTTILANRHVYRLSCRANEFHVYRARLAVSAAVNRYRKSNGANTTQMTYLPSTVSYCAGDSCFRCPCGRGTGMIDVSHSLPNIPNHLPDGIELRPGIIKEQSVGICPPQWIVANVRIEIQAAGVAEGIRLEESSGGVVVVAGTVVVEARFDIVATAREQVRIVHGAGADLDAVDVADRGPAEHVVRVAFHEHVIHIAKSHDGAEAIEMVEAGLVGVRTVYQTYRLIDPRTINEFPQKRVRAIVFGDDLVTIIGVLRGRIGRAVDGALDPAAPVVVDVRGDGVVGGVVDVD